MMKELANLLQMAPVRLAGAKQTASEDRGIPKLDSYKCEIILFHIKLTLCQIELSFCSRGRNIYLFLCRDREQQKKCSPANRALAVAMHVD
jgi:hypothetical protein